MRRIRSRMTYANVAATLALVIAIGGGTAYAADTVFSSDIVDGEVKTADIGNNQVRSADVRDDSRSGGGLTGADINEGSLDVVQGRGTLLSNRIVSVPPATVGGDVLLDVPGLGSIVAYCSALDGAFIQWENRTGGPVDFWLHNPFASDDWDASVVATGIDRLIVDSDSPQGATLALGKGNSPGPRTTATVHAFAFQEQDGAPCGFQAQATVWTSE